MVQDGESSHMLWKIDELIAYVSQYFTLKIGDVIFTGTPAGVGPVKQGDILTASLEGKKLLICEIK
jgi:2-keto-4-pentenoate hydratase/2-oxohepta-3-ene-1,7-dioic acid hydratase in catechol pathway